MSNGYGNVRVSRAKDMAAHDQLPPPLRYALNYAVGPWSAYHCQKELRFGIPQRAIVRMIVRGDRADTLETYGPNHPEAGHD